ncbi:Protein required for normal rRNA processing [Phaffia rhodozyma]|uniref:Pescadillo homolog n=1 Tax=Phaffia rhodozyma TaxID=264483 RepID=A0A0F7SQM4_PHARH|nr:Protein required for normal rRNA processing [Phaffia rhodozyma]
MAKIKRRGESGAAKNYVTRNQAIKKLQVSLADFRRLCILKGIFPRVPKHAKRANKGSTAPASFYYQKDIQYLLHEPVLVKLREHKSFAKHLKKAIGRGEWAKAKGLEESRPVYRLDHILKERYPTFPMALRDLPDALSLISLFSMLPVNPTPTSTLPKDLSSNCARLMAEWKLYIMREKALRKVFFSIKGVYYQVELHGEKITWLEAYGFTQHVPTDVDVRILMTFLELHQTLLGFVLFKLYTDANLIYPPPLDQEADESGAGFGAFTLKENKETAASDQIKTEAAKPSEKAVKKVSRQEVKKGIKKIEASGISTMEVDNEEEQSKPSVSQDAEDAEEFVERASKSTDPATTDSAPLPTLSSLTELSAQHALATQLFKPYTIYISREVPRQTLEFILRSFGCARIGWDTQTLGAGADFTDPNDPSITHVIVDRPTLDNGVFHWSEGGKKQDPSSDKRTFIQPQWAVDCSNQGKILPAGDYAPGQVLPPHLSPFYNDHQGGGVVGFAADSRNAGSASAGGEGLLDEEDMDEDDSEDDSEDEAAKEEAPKASTSSEAFKALSLDPTNEVLRHEAELEAEQQGVPMAAFEADLVKATKAAKKSGQTVKSGKRKGVEEEEEDLRMMVASNKTRKLKEKMDYSNKEKRDEIEKLKAKKLRNEKEAKKAAAASSKKAKKSTKA